MPKIGVEIRQGLVITVGDIIGRLVVREINKQRNGFSISVECSCSPGTIVNIQAGQIARGRRSCGCVPRGAAISETKRSTSSVGGASVTHRSEYLAYRNMLSRCLKENNPQYSDYGGRGITVCSRWIESFDSFLVDMGRKPAKDLTLERKNNNLGYSKENCIWASRHAQTRNERRNVNVTFNGETMCLEDWARRLGMSRQVLEYRIKRWGVEKALTIPLGQRGGRYRQIGD